MKKILLYLPIPILLLIAGSCKKPCYTCYANILSPLQIDTIYYNGHVRYDTTGGVLLNGGPGPFIVCDIDSHYHYGNYTFNPIFRTDTVTVCTLNN